jgi:hypothetical protein
VIKLYLSVNDGKAVFATHFINCNLEGVRKNLAPFQCEKNGIVIYLYDDMAIVEGILQEHEIPYTVETLDCEQHKTKSQGIKYASRSEAIKHLLGDDEPESQIIPNMKKKLEAEKIRNDNLELKLLKMEEKTSKGGL